MAHTIKVIALGFALLAVCLLAGWLNGGGAEPKHIGQAALVFIALWAIGAGINMWFGVARAGYGFTEELPFFFVVYLVPALPALFIWWRCSRS